MPYCPPYEKEEREQVASIKAAIAGQGGWLNGKPERRLAELIAEGLGVDDAVTVIDGRDWSTHLPEVRGKRIFDYLEARAAMIPAEAAELRRARADARRAEEQAERERAELRRRQEEEAAALQKLREDPAVAADRMDGVWSAIGGRPVGQNGNGHNGQNGKEPTGA
jgi:hypothetical protein